MEIAPLFSYLVLFFKVLSAVEYYTVDGWFAI
jgi:hypothetical protein